MRIGDLDELLEVMSAFEPIVQGRHDGIGLVEHGMWAGLCEIVKDAPTIDAVPVVHGQWVDNGRFTFADGSLAVVCTQCGCALTKKEYRKFHWNYCPVCGARMDGESE